MQEFEFVTVKVPVGFVPRSHELVLDFPSENDLRWQYCVDTGEGRWTTCKDMIRTRGIYARPTVQSEEVSESHLSPQYKEKLVGVKFEDSIYLGMACGLRRELVFGRPRSGDLVFNDGHWTGPPKDVSPQTALLIARYVRERPSWRPPAMIAGWLTNDTEGWMWWRSMPFFDASGRWFDAGTGSRDAGRAIDRDSVELLGFPSCEGFDRSGCWWKVGE